MSDLRIRHQQMSGSKKNSIEIVKVNAQKYGGSLCRLSHFTDVVMYKKIQALKYIDTVYKRYCIPRQCKTSCSWDKLDKTQILLDYTLNQREYTQGIHHDPTENKHMKVKNLARSIERPIQYFSK